MGLFKQNSDNVTQFSKRQTLEKRYKEAYSNILLVVVMTVINIVLLAVNSGTYFLFSAFIPYFVAAFGLLFGKEFPADIQIPEVQIASTVILIVALGLAVVMLGLYLLSWAFARKGKCGWLIFALVFFSIDTLVLLVFGGFSLDSVLDYLFHGGVIVSFAMGISAFSKLKKLPEEPEETIPAAEEIPVAENIEE